MRRENILTQTKRLSFELETRLKVESSNWPDEVEKCKESRDMVIAYIKIINSLVDTTKFRNDLEEVIFFHELTPKFHSKYFYYFKLWEIEVKMAVLDDKKKKAYLLYKLKRLLIFKEENAIEYHELLVAKNEAAERYFLRINDTGADPQLYSSILSRSKCTSHSVLLALFKANDRLIRCLQKKIKRLR